MDLVILRADTERECCRVRFTGHSRTSMYIEKESLQSLELRLVVLLNDQRGSLYILIKKSMWTLFQKPLMHKLVLGNILSFTPSPSCQPISHQKHGGSYYCVHSCTYESFRFTITVPFSGDNPVQQQWESNISETLFGWGWGGRTHSLSEPEFPSHGFQNVELYLGCLTAPKSFKVLQDL